MQRLGKAHGTVLLVASLAMCGLFSASASAQEVGIQLGRGPHYLGEPIEIQVVASDFAEDPTPEVEAAAVSSGRLRYAGVSDSSSTSISFVNGRMSRVKEVHFVYRFEFTANEQGRVEIPPFTVTQAGQNGAPPTRRSTQPFALQISGVPSTGLVGLSVELPEGPFFVGQKVPVEVALRIDREAQRDLLTYQAAVPLFDLPTLRFIDDSPAGSDSQLEIETAAGTLRLPATATEERINGRPMLVLRARRTMIAMSPDEIRASAPRVVISRGTHFRRDLFNQRQPTASERLMAQGDPVRIEVIEVPREGRPASFAGAVGKGFTLDVSADRSVVQLGEPILLSFDLQGNGDLSTASLPPLDAEGLFDPTQFRLPEDPPAGIVDETGKHFQASVRVIDANAREIPGIAYSWFDADTRAFETTYSRPIALSVGAAEIIGADAVTRRQGAEVDAVGVSSTAASPATEAESTSVRSTSLAFTGANLAVDEDADRVLGSAVRGGVPPIAVPALYVLGAGLLAFASYDRRRQAVDPRLIARARAFARAEKAIEAAATTAGASGNESSASAALGRALRELVAALPEVADAEFDSLIAECDALRFAPGRSGDSSSGLSSGQASSHSSGDSSGESSDRLPAELVARARRFVSTRRAALPVDGHARSAS